MKSKQKGFTIVEVVFVVIALASIYGYIANIVKMVHALSDVLTGMEVARMIGIVVAPLGVVLGYL